MTRLLLAASVASLLGIAPALAQTQTQNQQISQQDRSFVEQAAQGGMAEVAAGNMAMQRGASPAVREFGRWMVTDHTAMDKTLTGMAEHLGITVPTAPNATQQGQAQRLEGLNGRSFDRAYIAAQVQDHEMVIKVFDTEANSGTDPRLRFFAQQALPVLQQHLAEAQDLQQMTGGMASSH